MDVSIIIVNYNTRVLLKACLESIIKNTKDIKYEIIVSDNNSDDGSIEMIESDFKDIKLIKNNENLGFGRANNEALKRAKGKYIFYLNSDTLLHNNAVKIFKDYWDTNSTDNTLGALGANLYDEEMKIMHSFGKFPCYRESLKSLLHTFLIVYVKSIFRFLNINYTILIKKRVYKKEIGSVDYITGADLFLKNDNNAYFDERFFLYYEETDLQLNLCNQKKNRIIIDGPTIQHLSGGSNNIKNDLDVYSSFSSMHFYMSKIIYFKKNHYHNLGIFLLKFFTLLIWCNPLFISKTKKNIKIMLSI